MTALQDFDGALFCLKKALSLDPFDWRLHFNLGCCCLEARQNSRAILHLKAAINLDKKCPEAWAWMGVALGHNPNAHQAFRNALKLKNDPVTHLQYGKTSFKCTAEFDYFSCVSVECRRCKRRSGTACEMRK